MGRTEVCNQALARLGATRINDFGDASERNLPAVHCRLFFEQTAKALMRSHLWWFATGIAQLSQSPTTPLFQWAFAYDLPNDYLRRRLVWDVSSGQIQGRTFFTYELQGKQLLTDQGTVFLKYIKWVTDVSAWDTLFIEVFILALASKLVIPLSQSIKLKEDIKADLVPLMRQVRALDRQEGEAVGREELRVWNDARFTDIA